MNHSKTLMLVCGLFVSGLALADHHEGEAGKDDRYHHGGMQGGMQDGMRGGMGPGMMLDRFDTDKDGRISKDEMRAGTDKLFAEVDTSKDGFISKEEMAAHHKAMHDKMHERMHDRMQERWKGADKDGDGALSKAEVDAAKMPRLSRDFDKLDKNKDGKLSPDEIPSMMPERPPK